MSDGKFCLDNGLRAGREGASKREEGEDDDEDDDGQSVGSTQYVFLH